jgi:beta-galactosidase/beta-glucuronidase
VIGLLSLGTAAFAQEPLRAPMITQWGEWLDPHNVLPEYPRPQLVRTDWLNLNGTWEFALLPPNAERPERFTESILVPFPVESALSGVRQHATDEAIWYRRTFTLPSAWDGRRVLLHFGAVDWEARVWVNGELAGEHRGGYDPFTFDITDALQSAETHEVVVRAWDPSDGGQQPHGKQVRDPGGIWYTPSSGIWQTVWLEPVPESHIADLDIEPDLAAATLSITPNFGGSVRDGDRLEVTLLDESARVATVTATLSGGSPTASVDLVVDDPKPWSPDSPFLYDLHVRLWRGNDVIDEVSSYTGLRDIEIGSDQSGDLRLVLNGEPLFHQALAGEWHDTVVAVEARRY